MLISKLNDFYLYFTEISKSSPVIAGALSLYGLAVLTFIFRNIPSSILGRIKREVTTTLVVNSNDPVFYDFLKWVTINKNHSFVRNFNLTNPSKYSYGEAILSIGYGRTYFVFNKHVFAMDRIKVDANNTSDKKEVITLTLLGRNKNIFNTLFSTIKEFNTGETPYTNIYQYKDKMWQELTKNYKRKLNTVAIEKDKRDLLVGYIDGFTKDKSWYIENGVPWKTGILLSGPPGTGKTSLIKALCAHYNRPIYIINLAAISDDGLRDALSSVPEGSIVALEDIDAAGIGSPRTSATPSNQNDTKSAQGPSLSMEGSFNILTLSGVLNAIDGVASGEGRILIATTNHPEMLDPALVREGRFDLKVEIGYMNDETYFDYLKRFYPTFNFVGYHVLPNIAPCLVQKLVFENKNNPEKVLKQTSVKKGLSCCNFSFLENGPNETHPNLPN